VRQRPVRLLPGKPRQVDSGGGKREARKANRYNPNYKLRYQHREYHIDRAALKCRRVENAGAGALAAIRKSTHTLGLVLSMFINLGLSSRQTREALKGLFGISVSHQTVINYVMHAASALSGWLDAHLPVPGETAAGDETYIQVGGVWHYTWFVMDCATRALCGYNLSDTRGRVPALQTLVNAYGEPEGRDGVQHTFIRDGLGSYDNALAAYNQMDVTAGRKNGKPALLGKKVIGLENTDSVSEEYRQYKQIIERLSWTYKFHTRPRCGFKNLDGATALTTLFVAYYNHLRPHSRLKGAAPVPLPKLREAALFPQQWERLIELACA
jgi:putative transposase